MTAVPFNTRLKAEIIEELDAYAQAAAADAAASAADAATSVGAVLQKAEIALQFDDGLGEGAWYSEFIVPTDTTYSKIRYWVYMGSATCDVYVNVNNNNVLGPFSATTTSSYTPITLSVSEGDHITFQLDNVVSGTGSAIFIRMEGLPT